MPFVFQRLETIMTRRQKQYYEFRQSIALRAKHFFIVLLSNRQYTGKMAFNHKKEMLDITVSESKYVSIKAILIMIAECYF